jgi:transposase-like protein
MKEDDAYRWFKRARWHDNGGKPYCPECGNLEIISIRRKRFRCTATECRREFSVTSGTILANRKLKFRTLVHAIALAVHSVKGKAAAHLKRELGVDYKTAFVLLHKLREAIAAEREQVKLQDVVEMDGMYVGGHVRPENRQEDRVDRRLAENQTGKRMAIIALRERGPGSRTLVAVAPEERGDVAWHLVKNHVQHGAELRADQHKSYDELVGLATMVRNDHSKAYVETADASTNQAESFFSRARRAEIGIYHRMAGKYLDWYAADLAWREDKRRTDFRSQAKLVLRSAMAHPISRNMAGYWQRKGKAKQALVGWSPLIGMRSPAPA